MRADESGIFALRFKAASYVSYEAFMRCRMSKPEYEPNHSATLRPSADEGEDQTTGQVAMALDMVVGKSDDDGIEIVDEGEGTIATPYDPSKTNIITKQQSIDSLAKRIEHGEIDMAPEFQRYAGLWSDVKMSRLIESLLIRIPLPTFYFDGSKDERWLVVDGLQRLSTFERFLVKNDLPLTGLEYLTNYNGSQFDDLPRDLQRRIEETQVTLHIIQAGTPRAVKFNIFKRINTGGLPLKPQEIRHALYQGPATQLLAKLAEGEAFQMATSSKVSPYRMADREMVLRYIAFTMTPYTKYKNDNLDEFLNQHMEQLNSISAAKRETLASTFSAAMHASYEIFGDRAFRKPSGDSGRKFPISKPLFEAWSVVLGNLTPQQHATLIKRRDVLYRYFEEAFADQSTKFDRSLTISTNNAASVRIRFSIIEDIVARTLNEPPL